MKFDLSNGNTTTHGIRVGIDPANSCCGLAVVCGDEAKFETVDLWNDPWDEWLIDTIYNYNHFHPIRWVAEVPQNGTHASREGVVRALGGVVTFLHLFWGPVSKPKLGKNTFYPRDWRQMIYGHHNHKEYDYKQLAIDTVLDRYEVDGNFDHNAAEALLLTEML